MEQLARLRELKGFSQRALAKESGVSPATIYELENGRRRANPSTLRKLAGALDVEVADLLGAEYPKEGRRSSLEPTLFNGLEEERRLRYLRAWRAFVHGLARRWRKQPPKTSAEISPLFEAMSAVVEQGIFEPSDVSASEAGELSLLMGGFQRLNDIADKVQKDEEAEKRRATFALIQEKASA